MKKNAFGLSTKSSEVPATKPTKSQLMDARKLLLAEAADPVIKKAISKALDDEDKDQASMIKMLFDRMIPISEFESRKDGARTAVTITISGIGENPIIEGKPEDVEEV